MATAQLIDATNFDTLLVQSTQGRAGTPDGNIYFDTANDRIEIITAEELANVDLGSGAEANPLTNALGITLQALYAFQQQERAVTASGLRNFLPGAAGVFDPAGAWRFINGVKLADDVNASTGDDRTKIRGSGWEEYAAAGDGQTSLDRVYFGSRSLNNINSGSQPYIQIPASLSESDLQAAAPTDASRTGPLDEAFQVFGSTANGDTGAGSFDFRARPLVAKVRTFGQTQGQATSTGSGVARLDGFSTGFGLGEAVSPVNDLGVTEADVFGGSAISPFTGISFERFGSGQTRTGFTQADGDFTDIISNANAASLLQIRAWMDAAMRSDADIDDGAGTFLAKRADPLYTIDTDGRLVTRQGLHIDNVPAADQQSIVQTDDSGNAKTYPFVVEVRVSVSDAWQGDANAWYTCHYKDGAGGLDHDTASAVLVQDASSVDVTGTEADATGSSGSYIISFTYDYDGNTQAGLTAGTDKDVVFKAGGNGGAAETVVEFTITRQAIVTAAARSPAETNI